MTLTQERRKHRITPETLALYQRVREFHDCPTPVDPGLRQYRQQSCIDTARALHQALGRSPSEHCVMDIGTCSETSSRTTKAITGTDYQQSESLGKVVTPRRVSRRSSDSPPRVYGLLHLLNIWLSLCLV